MATVTFTRGWRLTNSSATASVMGKTVLDPSISTRPAKGMGVGVGVSIGVGVGAAGAGAAGAAGRQAARSNRATSPRRTENLLIRHLRHLGFPAPRVYRCC
jgi:hypothetical protein